MDDTNYFLEAQTVYDIGDGDLEIIKTLCDEIEPEYFNNDALYFNHIINILISFPDVVLNA